MRITDFVRAALLALRLNTLRSVLTTLGIIIGVASVIVMSAIGRGASVAIERQIASLGTNVLTISPGSSRFGGRQAGAGSAPPLTEKDLRAVRSEIAGVEAVSGNLTGTATVVYGNTNWTTAVSGTHAEFPLVRDWPLDSGRFFSTSEALGGQKVAVLGASLARELFGDGDPVGATVRVSNVPFEVIGLLEARGQSMMGRDQDDVIVLPVSTARSRVLGRGVTAPDQVGSLLVKVAEGHDVRQVESDVRDLLRERRRVSGDEAENFAIRNFAEMMETRSATQRTLGVLLAATAAISLVVGGIGIMNIMLVSVTERTREIGLRLAVGARGRDILGQFLTEAVLLSLVGGLIGLLIGLALAFVLGAAFGWPVSVGPGIVTVALLAAAGVGILFGYVPARRAARLNPIEALRYE